MDSGLDVFLLGAGASHESGDCQPHVPPLGIDLYASLWERDSFRTLIPDGLAAEERCLATTLSKLWDQHPDRVVPVLNQIALYFAEFRPGAANLYAELGKRIRERVARTVLASLNVEMLLEMSLYGIGVPYHYEGTLPAQGAMVLKPHGSANFLPTLAGASVSDQSLRQATKRSGLACCNAIQIVYDPVLVKGFISTTGLPPMVAAYLPNKPIPYCEAVIRDLWATWRRVVGTAKSLTIIGVDLDGAAPHIWEALRPMRGSIEYVGTDADAIDKLTEKAPEAPRISVAGRTFDAYLRSPLSS